MRTYKLTLDEVRKYRNDRCVSVTRSLLSEVIDNFDDWVVTVTKYDNIEDNNGWQYVITFKNIVRGEYNNRLENRFNYEYFLSLFNNLHEHNILTSAQIMWYIDNTNIFAETKDRLRQYCNTGYSWECDFLVNDSEYPWQLNVVALDERSIPAYLYTDKLVFNFGKNLLSIQESSGSCESSQVSETSEPAVEKIVNDVRSNSNVWYLSKRQLRDYYDNMSSYSHKIETAIHDYDNYCVRIEKNDDAYTLIIDKMQPDIMRNFYVATIDRHMFNTILGISSDEDACDCDSDAEEIDDDEEVIWEEESVSDEEVEDRSMSEDIDIDSLFTVVDGQLRRLLLQNEFNRFRNTLICPSYAVDEISNNYDNFNVFIIKDSSSHYSIIADKIFPYVSSYYKNGFGGDDCLVHHFGQDFVNKFNEVYEEHNHNINTSNTPYVTVDWQNILRGTSRRVPDNFAINLHGVPCRLLRKDEFEQYANSLNGGLTLRTDCTVSRIYNDYDNYNVYITKERTQLGNPFKLTVNQLTPWKTDFWKDGFTYSDLVNFFGEDFARQVNAILPGIDSYVNDFRVNDHYHRYLTKDEFEKYASRFGIVAHSQINNILNHYENYIVYISNETTDGGSPYKLNVIDAATNELFYWDGFGDAALENCFGFDVARDVHTLDPINSASIAPRELYAAQYMQNPQIVITDDIPMSNTACEEEPVSDEIRTIDQLVIALDRLRQQRIAKLDALPVACASNMNRHEQYDYDDSTFDDNLLVNIDNLINSLNRMREHEEV